MVLLSGCSDEAEPELAASAPADQATTSTDFAREAVRICTDAKQEFESLADSIDADPDDADPLLEALVRPGALIYARQAERFRELEAAGPTTELVTAYLDYFEVIDALLNARLRVGAAGGPPLEDRRELESRFEAMANEQAAVAAAAGLPECDFDVIATIFGS